MAVALAVRLNSEVTLLHIIEKEAPPVIHGDRHLTTALEAESYLETVRKQHFPVNMTVNSHVHAMAVSSVAGGISKHQAELRPDLTIICTHGRSGLRQIMFGSIAQQVVESGRTPVLIIRPQSAALPPGGRIRTLLVAADNDPEHVQGLSMALEFGLSIRAQVQVIGVVPTIGTLAGRHAATGRFLPATTYQLLEIAEKELELFVRQIMQSSSAPGADISLKIGRGDPASIITKTAEAVAADIIILGTHGKAGTRALWSGSVTSKIIKQTLRPLLLVPVKRAGGRF